MNEERRATNLACLVLGSNIQPERHLPQAVELLKRFGRILKVSQVWESKPVDGSPQPNYLNAAVLLQTPLEAAEIFEQLIPQVEAALKRQRVPDNKNAPRTIDVDLVLYNQEVKSVAGHQLPSPELLTRPFVAVPVAEVYSADDVHPETGERLSRVAERLLSCFPKLTLREDVTRDLRQAAAG